MQTTFAVLAEPNRRRILDELSQGERSVNELVESLALSQPAVSKHLRVLRDAELVTARVDRQHRRYRLRPERLQEIDAWLSPYRRFWAGRLDALEDYLNQEPSSDPDQDQFQAAPQARKSLRAFS